MPTTLVTGCDYGIGFEFARQYAADGWRVHAVCLDAGSRSRIESLGQEVVFHHQDVTDVDGLRALAGRLSDEPIDVLLNNAATFAPDGPGTLQLPAIEEVTRVMTVNAVAPVYVADAFETHVARSERRLMAFLGTRSGSIGDNTSGGHYAYRCSKAALNMAVKSLAMDLGPQGIRTVVLHPGSVATETRKGGQIDVTTSVTGMRRVIEDFTADMTGTFQRYDGGTIEW